MPKLSSDEPIDSSIAVTHSNPHTFNAAITAAAGVVGNLTGNASGTAGALAAGGVFLSDEVTGNGSAQSTAHGLEAVPSLCFAVPTYAAADAILSVSPGTHTDTNAVFTATNGVKYRVVAIK